MRQIAKRSHHATSVPFLSSLASFSFLPPRFSSSSLPIGYLPPTTNVAQSFPDVSRRNQTHDSVISMISRERNWWCSVASVRSLMGSRSARCYYRFYIEPIIFSAVLQIANNFHLHENNRLLGGNLRNWNLYNYIAIMRLLLPLCTRGLSYHKMLHRIFCLEYTFQLRNTITLYHNKTFLVPRKSFSDVFFPCYAKTSLTTQSPNDYPFICVLYRIFFLLHLRVLFFQLQQLCPKKKCIISA